MPGPTSRQGFKPNADTLSIIYIIEIPSEFVIFGCRFSFLKLVLKFVRRCFCWHADHVHLDILVLDFSLLQPTSRPRSLAESCGTASSGMVHSASTFGQVFFTHCCHGLWRGSPSGFSRAVLTKWSLSSAGCVGCAFGIFISMSSTLLANSPRALADFRFTFCLCTSLRGSTSDHSCTHTMAGGAVQTTLAA